MTMRHAHKDIPCMPKMQTVLMQAEAAAEILRIQNAVAGQVLTAAEAEQQLQEAQGQIHDAELHVKELRWVPACRERVLLQHH